MKNIFCNDIDLICGGNVCYCTNRQGYQRKDTIWNGDVDLDNCIKMCCEIGDNTGLMFHNDECGLILSIQCKDPDIKNDYYSKSVPKYNKVQKRLYK